MTTPLCIYHGNCADGFTAAWVVRQALGEDVEFHAGIYGQPPPVTVGRDVIMVDFSYKRPVLMDIANAASTVLILDHHKTAAADLAGFPPAVEIQGEKIAAIFDMERSGAQVTWDFFFPRQPRPLLVDYTGDRDLWQFKLPMSREVNAYVFANEYSFENWDMLDKFLQGEVGKIGSPINLVVDMGGAIERKHHKDIAELVGVVKRRMTIGGYDVPVANLPYTFTSDAGHLMAQGEAFAACYWDTPNGRVFSLRSTDAGTDVSDIAKLYGGGGHRNASGFQMPIGWEGESR